MTSAGTGPGGDRELAYGPMDVLLGEGGLTDLCVVARCADKNTELGLNWIEFQP